jgi:seryl-tRNA synthetase
MEYNFLSNYFQNSSTSDNPFENYPSQQNSQQTKNNEISNKEAIHSTISKNRTAYKRKRNCYSDNESDNINLDSFSLQHKEKKQKMDFHASTQSQPQSQQQQQQQHQQLDNTISLIEAQKEFISTLKENNWNLKEALKFYETEFKNICDPQVRISDSKILQSFTWHNSCMTFTPTDLNVTFLLFIF